MCFFRNVVTEHPTRERIRVIGFCEHEFSYNRLVLTIYVHKQNVLYQYNNVYDTQPWLLSTDEADGFQLSRCLLITLMKWNIINVLVSVEPVFIYVLIQPQTHIPARITIRENLNTFFMTSLNSSVSVYHWHNRARVYCCLVSSCLSIPSIVFLFTESLLKSP